MQKSQAARKNAKQGKTMLGRMQRAADRIKEAREEMSKLETMLGRNNYVTTDMLCVHETLSDGLQALQRMMDGDERNEYEQLHAEYKRRDDKLEAAGDLIMGATGQLQRAAELFGECCDEAGWVCDDPNVPNTEEIRNVARTADVWAMCTIHAAQYSVEDTDAETDRENDQLDNKIDAYEEPDNLDKTIEAYEEMMQYEMQRQCAN